MLLRGRSFRGPHEFGPTLLPTCGKSRKKGQVSRNRRLCRTGNRHPRGGFARERNPISSISGRLSRLLTTRLLRYGNDAGSGDNGGRSAAVKVAKWAYRRGGGPANWGIGTDNSAVGGGRRDAESNDLGSLPSQAHAASITRSIVDGLSSILLPPSRWPACGLPRRSCGDRSVPRPR